MMTRFVNALTLLLSLGCKAESLHDSGMVYGFGNVSLNLYRTMACKAFRLSNKPPRLNHQLTSRGHRVSMTSPALDWRFLWIIQTEAVARRQSPS